MFDWNNKKKYILLALAGIIVCAAGMYATALYQPETKTEEIYKSALKDYRDGNYQNSYYLFSKITVFSNLKPVSIYHRAECARMLGDKNAEIKQYEFLFNNYPKHKLSLKAKYNTAQILAEEKPELAKRYFKQILEYAPNTDYAIASEYYLGLILKNEYKGLSIPKNVSDTIQKYFRGYVQKAPSGRLALNAVSNWLEVSDDILPVDYLLMANTCYLFEDYDKAIELLEKADKKIGWVLLAKSLYAQQKYAQARSIIEEGLSMYSSYVSQDDIIAVIDIYNMSGGQKDRLSSFVTGGGKDYLTSLKCVQQTGQEKVGCYNKLYMDYPNGRFAADALSNVFFAKIKSGDLQSAIELGKEHLNKFPNANSTPMVMFWLGKIYEKTNNYNEYTAYYRNTIERFPDSYYAYRAYLRLKKTEGPLITIDFKPQPVEYPYSYTKDNIIVKLVNLGDYDIVNEFAGDDEFIKSWLLYKKGDYLNSVVKARNAMDSLTNKPGKYDLRWRLVYPVMYYDDLKFYTDKTGNNLPLMLALLKEESHFNPNAKSSVGASGLMQLMPATASEINSKYSLGLNIEEALFIPKKNIELGNYYYEFLRSNLEGHNISSVAAYNGGIGSIKNWKTNLHYRDTDEFIEQIPYPETRNYVKKVFRSYWNYIRIYE